MRQTSTSLSQVRAINMLVAYKSSYAPTEAEVYVFVKGGGGGGGGARHLPPSLLAMFSLPLEIKFCQALRIMFFKPYPLPPERNFNMHH